MRHDTETTPFFVEGLRARLRAANPVPPPPNYLVDQVLRRIQQVTCRDVPFLDSGEDAEPVEPVKRTRQRRPSVASVIRQMSRAGLEIAGCKINHDGTTSVMTGKPVQMKVNDERNEWDTVQ